MGLTLFARIDPKAATKPNSIDMLVVNYWVILPLHHLVQQHHHHRHHIVMVTASTSPIPVQFPCRATCPGLVVVGSRLPPIAFKDGIASGKQINKRSSEL